MIRVKMVRVLCLHHKLDLGGTRHTDFLTCCTLDNTTEQHLPPLLSIFELLSMHSFEKSPINGGICGGGQSAFASFHRSLPW